ncbi:MAG TPA: DUF89 family protein [Aquifex aeolicus]|nr:DUF89 family protein [Aquifex aeolicus]
MRAYPVCVPCLINQGLNAVKKLGLGEDEEREISLRAIKYMSRFDELSMSPAYYAYHIQKIVSEVARTKDPFREYKKIANAKAKKLLKKVGDRTDGKDPLERAIRLSALGNYIDFALMGEIDLEKDIPNLVSREFAVRDFRELRDRLRDARNVLIIGDNAGEIVFDKPLVRVLLSMGKDVCYAVKGAPILNDATLEDAVESGMVELCKVLSNGSDKVGTWLEDCSEEFKNTFESADVVISKGQANFETLSSVERDIFFLLVAKCEPIARESGGEAGKFILKYKPRRL